MRWPWQRRVAPEAAQQRPRVVPPRREWMGLAPLQRTVPSPTLTTATGGFSSRLASRSARPLVQPLTHGVMHDAPAGHLDGVARPSAAAAPVVDAPAQPDLPLAGERVVAQRTAVVRRTALTAATATAPPGRRVRAVPAVQRTQARPEAATPVEARADAPVVAAEHAATDTPVVAVPSQVDGAAPDGTTEPEIPGAVTHAPVEGGGLPPATGPMTPEDTTGATSLVEASDGAVAAAAPLLGAMPGPDAAIPPPGTPHVARTPADSGVDIAPARGDLPLPNAGPGATPTSPPSGSPPSGSPSVGALVVGVPSSGSPSPGSPPVAPAAPGRPPVQRATLADGPHPPRRSGLGAPLVSPVQRSARTGAPGARSGPPAPSSGLPSRESPATATPADAPGPGGPDGAGGGAADGVSGPDVPTIGERTPPATLDVQRSARGDGADDGPASDAAVRPAAPEPEAAPSALPLQRTTGSAQGSGATPGPSPGDRQRSGGARPGGSARAGVSPTGTAGAHEPGAPLPLQRARTAAGPHADTVEAGTPGTAPVVPGDATAPAGADAPPRDAGAHVAAASPHLPPPLVPHAGAGMLTMPLLAQRAPLLQRMPAAGSDGEVDGGSPPPPGAAGPPSGGVARATQMSATVPSPRGGQGAGPRATHAGRTVQPLRRAGNGAGAAAQPPSPSATQAAAQPAASRAAPGSPGAPGAWASPGAPVRAGGEGSVAIAAADQVSAAPGSGGPVDGDAFAQTLMPGPPRATRGPVTTAVAAGVQRLVARAARPGAARSPAPRADAAMTVDNLAGGLAVGPSRPAATDAPAGAGAVDLAMPPVQLRPAPDGATAAQPVPMQTIAAPAPVAPAPPVSAVAAPPVVQRAPEPVEVAGTPPSTAEPVAAVTAGAAATGGSMPRSEEDLDVLAGRLYDHIAGRLRRELRVDRERTGLLTDLQG